MLQEKEGKRVNAAEGEGHLPLTKAPPKIEVGLGVPWCYRLHLGVRKHTGLRDLELCGYSSEYS